MHIHSTYIRKKKKKKIHSACQEQRCNFHWGIYSWIRLSSHLERKKLQGTEEPFFTFSGSPMWMQDQKGALALTTLTPQATSSSTLLWFCGLSHRTDHPKFLPFVAWILWLMLAIYSLNIQPPKHLSQHAWYQHFGCLFVGSLCGLRFIPTVGLRALSAPSVTTYTVIHLH